MDLIQLAETVVRDAWECAPPHRVDRPELVRALACVFAMSGWDPDCPKLVGYEVGEPGNVGVQLLSGSHRWEAARLAGIKIPMVIFPYEIVLKAFGDVDLWRELMAAGDSEGKVSFCVS